MLTITNKSSHRSRRVSFAVRCALTLALTLVGSQSRAFKIDVNVPPELLLLPGPDIHFSKPIHEGIVNVASEDRLNPSVSAYLQQTTRAPDIADAWKLVLSGLEWGPEQQSHHFDNSNFGGGLSYVGSPDGPGGSTGQWRKAQLELTNAHFAVESERIEHAKSALDILGTILHANQDFYAHSNFVESRLISAFGGIGKAITPADLIRLDLSLWDRQISPGLSSGYYFSTNFPNHEIVNKDEPNSPQGKITAFFGAFPFPGPSLFDLAISFAETQTIQDIETFLAMQAEIPNLKAFEDGVSDAPLTGADLFDIANANPEYFDELLAAFDPTSIESWEQTFPAAFESSATPTPTPTPSTISLFAFVLIIIALLQVRFAKRPIARVCKEYCAE